MCLFFKFGGGLAQCGFSPRTTFEICLPLGFFDKALKFFMLPLRKIEIPLRKIEIPHSVFAAPKFREAEAVRFGLKPYAEIVFSLLRDKNGLRSVPLRCFDLSLQ